MRGYLAALAFALPFALLFTAFRGFNTAVSRPKIVMALQLGALALKVPLTALLVFGTPLGWARAGARRSRLRHRHRDRDGGCRWSLAWWLLRRDPFYARFGLHGPTAAARIATACWRCCAWACRWAGRSWSR